MRPEGFGPSPARLKICCAAITPRPRTLAVVSFDWTANHHLRVSPSSSLPIARDGVEPPLPPYQSDVLPLHHRASRGTGVSPVNECSESATGERPVPQIGMVGVEPTVSWSQATRGTSSPSSRTNDPCGIRTQPVQLERLTTSPDVERAKIIMRPHRAGPGGSRAFALLLKQVRSATWGTFPTCPSTCRHAI